LITLIPANRALGRAVTVVIRRELTRTTRVGRDEARHIETARILLSASSFDRRLLCSKNPDSLTFASVWSLRGVSLRRLETLLVFDMHDLLDLLAQSLLAVPHLCRRHRPVLAGPRRLPDDARRCAPPVLVIGPPRRTLSPVDGGHHVAVHPRPPGSQYSP
jgi:hypothetical protein